MNNAQGIIASKVIKFLSFVEEKTVLKSKSKKYHNERDSAFFRLRSKNNLARLLFSHEKKLSDIAREDGLYKDFEKLKKNGKDTRTVSAPRADLKAVQSRISDLLMRIRPARLVIFSCERALVCR